MGVLLSSDIMLNLPSLGYLPEDESADVSSITSAVEVSQVCAILFTSMFSNVTKLGPIFLIFKTINSVPELDGILFVFVLQVFVQSLLSNLLFILTIPDNVFESCVS